MPLVFGKPTHPSSSSSGRTTSSATSRASAKSVPGCGSRSTRSSSGRSVSAQRDGHGWKVTVPRLAAHATVASSTTCSASAVLPDGNVTWQVPIQSGRWDGARFW